MSGELKVECDIQVDGIIEGQLHVEGTLIVAESGRVKGDIYAKQIIVNGLLDGHCHAEHIQVLTKGRVNGKIWSNNLSIESGGKFFGEAAELPEKEIATLKDKSAEVKEAKAKTDISAARKSA